MKNIIKRLKEKFSVGDIVEKRNNLTFLTIDKEIAINLIIYLKEIEKFSHLVMLSAVDWLEDNKFQLSYILNNPTEKLDITIKVFVSRDNPVMDSINTIWPHAATDQRELKEMYGIEFPESPGLNDDFVLEGWDNIPPMRRDFDTFRYSEETFFPRAGRKTYNVKEYMKSKLYPDEKKSTNKEGIKDA
jgi:NADH-quinone oxidoreductase subunit C